MTLKIKNKIKTITEEINKANFEYYQLNNSYIKDETYDALFKELVKLEKEYPQYKLSNSPTLKVGGFLSNKFQKIKHDRPMLSLENVFNFQELKKFYDRIQKKEKKFTMITELKIDGVAISLKYREGFLFQALTRGDGYTGELVTHNIKSIKDIPLKIEKKINLEVRGEIFFDFDSFEELNKQKKKENKNIFANPRNAASGSLRQLDSNIVKKRNLSSFIYSVVNPPSFLKTQEDVLIFLKNMGFSVNSYYKKINSYSNLIEQIHYYENIKSNLPYNTDGIVIKINELSLYDSIGYTNKFPKWAIAYKFKTIQRETIIKNIFFQVGRTGAITPIAELVPIIIDGSLISKVSLHNYDYIQKKDIRINDFILIHKSGSIIPEIIKVIKEKRSNNLQKTFKMISSCPSCLSQLKKKEKEVNYFCINENCREKELKKIIHFVSREAMNINVLGKKTLEIFFNNGLIKKKSDLYEMNKYRDQILKLPFFQKKKIDNILNSIEKSKKKSFDNILFGLGISNVGSKVAKLLAMKFENISNLKKASLEQILEIPEIGEKIAQNVYEYFRNEKNLKELFFFEQNGLQLELLKKKDEKKEKIYNFFQNKKVVLTGIFKNFSRQQIKNILEQNGAIIIKNISQKTNFFIYGKNSSLKKMKKIKDLNNPYIKLINEEELNQILL
jgi:DNA ligase (NAD+)